MAKEEVEDLRAVSFLCALLVVSIHCWSPKAYFMGECALKQWQAAVLFLLTDSVSRLALPCFFIMSGFFLARGFAKDWSWYAKVLSRRFHSIYIPYVIWNLLYAALAVLAGKRGGVTDGELLVRIFSIDPYAGAACMPFWYLQTLIIWVLISPLSLRILKYRIASFPAIVLLTSAWMLNFRPVPFAISPWAFLWLVVGTVAAFNETDIGNIARCLRRGWRRVYFAGLFFALVSLKVYSGATRNLAAYSIAEKPLVLFGVFTVFVNADRIAKALLPLKSLFRLGFFIYAFHAMAISAFVMIMKCFDISAFVEAFAKMLGGIAVSILVGMAFRKHMPRGFAIVTGGRT